MPPKTPRSAAARMVAASRAAPVERNPRHRKLRHERALQAPGYASRRCLSMPTAPRAYLSLRSLGLTTPPAEPRPRVGCLVADPCRVRPSTTVIAPQRLGAAAAVVAPRRCGIRSRRRPGSAGVGGGPRVDGDSRAPGLHGLHYEAGDGVRRVLDGTDAEIPSMTGWCRLVGSRLSRSTSRPPAREQLSGSGHMGGARAADRCHPCSPARPNVRRRTAHRLGVAHPAVMLVRGGRCCRLGGLVAGGPRARQPLRIARPTSAALALLHRPDHRPVRRA